MPNTPKGKQVNNLGQGPISDHPSRARILGFGGHTQPPDPPFPVTIGNWDGHGNYTAPYLNILNNIKWPPRAVKVPGIAEKIRGQQQKSKSRASSKSKSRQGKKKG